MDKSQEANNVDYTEMDEYVSSYIALKQAGKFKGVVLVEECRWYISYNIYDAWSDKEHISYEKFKTLVIEAENAILLLPRKPPSISLVNVETHKVGYLRRDYEKVGGSNST